MKIKSGDTLSQIAKDKGMTLKALLAANPSIKNANQIRVGQSITIPPKAMVGKGNVSDNPYKGMSRTQMNMMDVKNKDKGKQEAATRGMQTQVKSGGSPTTPTKKKADAVKDQRSGRSAMLAKAEAVKAKKQKEEAQKKKLLKRAKSGRGF